MCAVKCIQVMSNLKKKNIKITISPVYIIIL